MARAAFLRQLKHTCTVQVSSDGGADVHGQPTLSEADENTGVACLWQDRRGGQRNDPYAERIDYDCLIFLAYDADFNETRQIVDVEDGDGAVIESGPLRIVWSRDAGGQQHHLQLYCKRSGILGVA